MRPVIALAPRKSASLMWLWRVETASRPNSLPPIDDNPARTRSLCSASSKFENLPAPRGEKPSWNRPNSPIPTDEYLPPHPPYHGWNQSPGPAGSHPTRPQPPNPKPRLMPQPPPPNPKNETYAGAHSG